MGEDPPEEGDEERPTDERQEQSDSGDLSDCEEPSDDQPQHSNTSTTDPTGDEEDADGTDIQDSDDTDEQETGESDVEERDERHTNVGGLDEGEKSETEDEHSSDDEQDGGDTDEDADRDDQDTDEDADRDDQDTGEKPLTEESDETPTDAVGTSTATEREYVSRAQRKHELARERAKRGGLGASAKKVADAVPDTDGSIEQGESAGTEAVDGSEDAVTEDENVESGADEEENGDEGESKADESEVDDAEEPETDESGVDDASEADHAEAVDTDETEDDDSEAEEADTPATAHDPDSDVEGPARTDGSYANSEVNVPASNEEGYDPATPPDDEEMPLTEHIEEMIQRLAIVLFAAAIVTLAIFPFASEIIIHMWFDILPQTDIAAPHVYGPLEHKLTELKLASIGGLAIALPVAVYQTYRFMRPGLYPHERRYYLAAVPTSLVLAIVGMAFAYYLVLPGLFEYFMYYSDAADEMHVAFGLRDTFALILTMLGLMAIVFQIPLCIMLAIMMGITSRIWLTEHRIYFWGAFLGIAFLFSPDPTGMAPLIVAITMVGLFEGTLLLVKWTGR